MPNPKTGSNRWVPDIRPDKVETATETNEKQSEQYRIVDAHPILGGILDKLAYFRTHAGAVWYNKLAGITVLQKLDNLASNIGVLAQLATTDKTSLVAAINTLSSQVDSLNSQQSNKADRQPLLTPSSFSGSHNNSYFKCDSNYKDDTILPFVSIPTKNGLWTIATYAFKEELHFIYHDDVNNKTVRCILRKPDNDTAILTQV